MDSFLQDEGFDGDVSREARMKVEIEHALSVLIGMPLRAIGSAANMVWLSFGERRTVQDRKGRPKEVGAYALHIQCSWRIVGPAGLVVGWRDIYYVPGDDPYAPEDYEGPTRRDAFADALIAQTEDAPLVVQSLEADELGGFRLQLSDGYTLEAFPDGTLPDERWRIFQPGSVAKHIVATGKGIERN